MADTKAQGSQARPADSDDYSASQAPETQQEAQDRSGGTDSRLMPGGARGSAAEIGLTAMDEGNVPSKAQKPAQLDVKDSPDDQGRARSNRP
jgi:hypothetical protein